MNKKSVVTSEAMAGTLTMALMSLEISPQLSLTLKAMEAVSLCLPVPNHCLIQMPHQISGTQNLKVREVAISVNIPRVVSPPPDQIPSNLSSDSMSAKVDNLQPFSDQEITTFSIPT